ncbi:YqkE family protein [Metabacillus endolithicus]|uniref:YqkE family protein n=1 Tax=Metabacillus endolithicus TaxID=1535204 RepID=A0ABW5BZ71_9BACI|nr:YqkE family protein [Metabacillus endolithicus]UPG64393.1 YqkE family protein [Metabacillus endolithicus]
MKKSNKKKKDDPAVSLSDHLNNDLLEQLKAVKKDLTKEHEEKEAALERKRIEERKQREKNKSFEELFNESSLSWKEFK